MKRANLKKTTTNFYTYEQCYNRFFVFLLFFLFQMMITSTLALVFGLMKIQFMVATVAVSPDPDVTCNSCCQGRDGIHGIPGSNGNHGPVGPRGDAGSPGEVGEPGTKGDKGSDGLVGEQGAKGDHGLKGEQGVGQPGKQGPQGMPGMDGLKGERGEHGPAGQTGEAGECSTRRSAFTAVRNTGFSPSSSYDPLPFEELLFSEEGTDFNLSNGTFTCTVPGIYVFMFSVLKRSSESSLYVRLMKNHDIIVTGFVNAAGFHHVSSSVVIPLHYGDQVHLAVYGQVYSAYSHFTSFTGFLLYEI